MPKSGGEKKIKIPAEILEELEGARPLRGTLFESAEVREVLYKFWGKKSGKDLISILNKHYAVPGAAYNDASIRSWVNRQKDAGVWPDG